MKKNVSVLRLALTLLIITATVAAALSAVNMLTQQRIADIEKEKTQKALQAVLPGATDMQMLSLEGNTGIVRAVYAPGEDSPVKGYAIEVAPAGFDGQIVMMVGIDADGKVVGVDIISHTETAGLGAVAGADNAKGEAFREQFVGADSALSTNKDGGSIDALTGATITSRAIVEGVNAALEYAKKLG